MDWQEIERRLLDSLYRELRGHWGRISEIEERLGVSSGYLAKLCAGRHEIKLGLFLRALEVLGLDHRAFLSRVLELQPVPEDYLRQVDDPDDTDAAFTRMAGATLELEAAEPPAAHRVAVATAGDVAAFATRPRPEQLRRLRASLKYRTHDFARGYLEHLDSLRYDHAEEAAKLATRVSVTLVPSLPGPQDGRLSLQCLALGVFGSARRLKGRFSAASRAFRLALEVSRRAGLPEDTANMLLRASYLLKDFGLFNRALTMLNEALATFVQLDSQWDIGRALVDQGMMHSALGDYRQAVLILKRALEHLAGSEVRLPRYHLSAYQFAAYAYEQLGQLDEAHACLERGANAFAPVHAVDAAKLQWLHGRLAFRQGDLTGAEQLLRTACAVLASKEVPGKEALVTLDLISVMLAQGRGGEASSLAAGMAPLLFKFKNNRLAEAALLKLVSAAAAGKLHEDVVRDVRAQIDTERPSRKGALSKN